MKTAAAVSRINFTVGPERVWSALRDPQQIAQWFGWDYPGLAEEIQTIFVHGADAVDETKTLHLGMHDLHVRPWGEGCMVELHRGPAPEGDQAEAWGAMLPDLDEGWISFLQQLRFWLEEAPAGLRQTLHFSGFAKADQAAPLWERLGLGEAIASPDGQAYQATLPWGEALAGHKHFATELQGALSFDAGGPALLLLAHAPQGQQPHEDPSATVITYGLPKEALKAMEAAWSAWWAQHHEA